MISGFNTPSSAAAQRKLDDALLPGTQSPNHHGGDRHGGGGGSAGFPDRHGAIKQVDAFVGSIREAGRFGQGDEHPIHAPRTFEQGLAQQAQAAQAKSKAPTGARGAREQREQREREQQRAWQARLVQKKWGSTDAKRHVLERVTRRTYAAHSTVVRQGDAADAMFFLQAGELDVVVGGRRVHVLRAGDFFGEYALLQDGVRTATIVARGPGECALCALAKKDFEEILHAHPSFEAELRPKRMYVMDMTAQRQGGGGEGGGGGGGRLSPQYAGAPGGSRRANTIVYRPRRGSLTELVMRYANEVATQGGQGGQQRRASSNEEHGMRQKRFFAGDEVCVQGAVADEMYFVLAGQLDVEVSGQNVHTVKEGEFFGEHALLVGGARSGTVRVAADVVDCVLYCISKAALDAMLLKHPEVREQIEARQKGRSYVTDKHVAFQRRQQAELEELDEAERAAGDMEMYTIANLMKRAALQDHPLVIGAIRRFWRLLDPTKHGDAAGDGGDGGDAGAGGGGGGGGGEGGEGGGGGETNVFERGMVTFGEYLALNVRMQKALVVNITTEEAEAIAARDWARDVAGGALAALPAGSGAAAQDEARRSCRMRFPAFSDALFELADIWCEDIDGGEYAGFIDDLLQAVTAGRSEGEGEGEAVLGEKEEEGEVRCVEGWMRRRYSAALLGEMQAEAEAPAPAAATPPPRRRRLSVVEMLEPERGLRMGGVPGDDCSPPPSPGGAGPPSARREPRRRRSSAAALYESMALLDRRAFLDAMRPHDRVVFWEGMAEDEQVKVLEELEDDGARAQMLASVQQPRRGGGGGGSVPPSRRWGGHDRDEESSEEEEEEEEEQQQEEETVVAGWYYATTGGGHYVRVETRVPVRRSAQAPAKAMDVRASVRAVRRQRRRAGRRARAAEELARNPVAARHAGRSLGQLLGDCQRATPFDQSASDRPSALLVTPSRYRRGPHGSRVDGLHGAAGRSRGWQQHVGLPGIGLCGPGTSGVHVRMEPGKPLLLPRVDKRPHFKPAHGGAAGHLERRQMSMAMPDTRCDVGATGFSCGNLSASKHMLYRTAQYLGSGRSSEEQFLGGSLKLSSQGGI